jgi:hypothetical protein
MLIYQELFDFENNQENFQRLVDIPMTKLDKLNEAMIENPRNQLALNLYSHVVLQHTDCRELKQKCYHLLLSVQDVDRDDSRTT